ncbi:hypothetical protein HHE02_12340 [Helicobacter heilmannii]|nr:hypothetical protein HHE02_12340 [Helicobacter heilmannii]
MKDTQGIFTQLLQMPEMAPLRMRLQLDQLKNALPVGVQMGLGSIALKDRTLLLAFKHPSALNYFNGQSARLIPLLLNAAQKLSIPTKPTAAKAFLPRMVSQSFKPKAVKFHYQERAKGEFENPFKDPKLKAILENIRACILQQQSAQNMLK